MRAFPPEMSKKNVGKWKWWVIWIIHNGYISAIAFVVVIVFACTLSTFSPLITIPFRQSLIFI